MSAKWWMLCVLLAASLPRADTSCKDKDKLNEIETSLLNYHNQLRAKHRKTKPLCYGINGSDVTFSSQLWAEKMAKKRKIRPYHSKWRKFSNRPYGENLFTGRTKELSDTPDTHMKMGLDAWYQEIRNWNFTSSTKVNPKLNGGNFTQMVWKDTEQVNCGYDTYQKSGWKIYFVVCQYYPKGNWAGEEEDNVFGLLPGPVTSSPNGTVIVNNPEYVVGENQENEQTEEGSPDDKNNAINPCIHHTTFVLFIFVLLNI